MREHGGREEGDGKGVIREADPQLFSTNPTLPSGPSQLHNYLQTAVSQPQRLPINCKLVWGSPVLVFMEGVDRVTSVRW